MEKSGTEKSKPIYFPGLNGLRAIAALAVVISHVTLHLASFGLDPTIFGTSDDGHPRGLLLAGYGVGIFFVLSGFLITYLLQAEKDKQEIDIGKFYIRRILRIWPLYYSYLSLSVLAIFYFGMDFHWQSLMFYLFYAANIPFILNTTLPFLAHYWSLGIEEQFYLFWPWFNKKTGTGLIYIVAALIVATVAARIAIHFLYPGTLTDAIGHDFLYYQMMIGALGALLYKSGNKLFLRLTDNVITQSICWLLLLLVAVNRFHIASVIDGDIICIAGLCLIIGQIRTSHCVIDLERPVFDFLGKISYGIYVIHPMIIFMMSRLLSGLPMPPPAKYILVYTSVVALTIITSYLSFEYFEKYFLNFKKRYTVISSSAARAGS